tara:strand:+ start:231 stop:407 length:177 start_codon:yes stop_codon:yes gene_type:complete
MTNKRRYEQQVEKVLQELDFKRGIYQPLSDQELSELDPELRNAVLYAREKAIYSGHDE